MDTVCTLLQHSISFNEHELKKKTLKFISKNTCQVLNTPAFLDLPHDAVNDVVGLDIIAGTSERQLYEACMKWAKHQLKKDDPSDEEIRATLGYTLYKIRFPTMTPQVFAEITTHSNILSAEEKLDVYVYMTTGEKLETLKFLSSSRQVNYVINRFTKMHDKHWICNGKQDAICIQSTVDMHLSGVGLFGGANKPSKHDVTLTVWKGNETVSTKTTEMISDGSNIPVKILLENPVCIHASTVYTVAVIIKGPPTWSGANDAHGFLEYGNITFFDPPMSGNGSSASLGQIPQLNYYT